jgi:hypothetical protein
MKELIEKYAIQCCLWPYWRDLPNDADKPSDFLTEWPEHITEDQKAFWRTFVTNMIEDLRRDTIVVEVAKIDEILSILKS